LSPQATRPRSARTQLGVIRTGYGETHLAATGIAGLETSSTAKTTKRGMWTMLLQGHEVDIRHRDTTLEGAAFRSRVDLCADAPRS
jgi:hypothetical protein